MERQTDILIGRQTDGEADRHTDRQKTDGEADRQIERQTDILIGRQTDGEADKLMGRETEEEADRRIEKGEAEQMLIMLITCVGNLQAENE